MDAHGLPAASCDVAKPGFDCMKSSVHANNDVILDGVELTTDHWVTANNPEASKPWTLPSGS